MTEIPLTIRDAAKALRAGTLTSVELTKAVLARADELDPVLGVYITRMDASALKEAERADACFALGIDKGPLQGIPVGLKDILATENAPTTAHSEAIDPLWGEQGDGPVVGRLRAAGAVIVGKNTTHEFASGSFDDEKPFPIPKNPWNTEYHPGGSSSGTGVGVAAGLFLGGVGTDTSGSVRWPAAACGVSGMMGTFGRVPKSGCTQNGFSLDHIGPLGRSAWDCAAMMQVMARQDPTDINSSAEPVPDYLAGLSGDLSGMNIAVVREGHTRAADCLPEVGERFEAAIQVIREAGAHVEEIVIPYFDQYTTAQWVNNSAEKSGIYVKRYRDLWPKWGRYTRVGMGSFGLFIDTADYIQSLRMRRHAQKALRELMEPYDAVLTPTFKGHIAKLADMKHPTSLGWPLYTSLWSWIGLPAIAVPMGLSNAGLPTSLQIAGKPFDEATVFKIADAFQRMTDWHLQLPPVVASEAAAVPVSS